MRIPRLSWAALSLAGLVAVCLFLSFGCTPRAPGSEADASPEAVSPSAPPPTLTPTLAPTPSPTPSPEPTPAPVLVEYTGQVEHIFFHPAIYDPGYAFSRWNAEDLDAWMVTTNEYKKMLESIYEKGFILVHLTDVYEEIAVDGAARMARKPLLLPEGKKPLLISYDDVNYYQYMRESGIVYKLILREDGEIWDYSVDPDGSEHITQERDIVTLLDAFVREHPDFSWNGAKGTLGLTGFEGVLGYHTFAESENRAAEIEAVKPVIARLKETGWDFASHTFGHPDLKTISLARLQHDADRWQAEVEPLTGPTPVLLYPYGSDPQKDAAKMRYLLDKGFRMFCAVGKESYVRIDKSIPAVFMDRRHPDGTTLRNRRSQYLDLYDAQELFDPARPDTLPVDFTR